MSDEAESSREERDSLRGAIKRAEENRCSLQEELEAV
jgi:hypothetical protein